MLFSEHLIFVRFLEVSKVSFRSRIAGYSFLVQYFAPRLPELPLAVSTSNFARACVYACGSVYPFGKSSPIRIPVQKNIWAFLEGDELAQTHSYCISLVKERRKCMRARLHNLPIMRASCIAHSCSCR